MKKGGINVQTENIFPVIKKWLYSDKDIFLRELVSNACDAITKHKRLVSLSEAEESTEPYKITVLINKAEKTLSVTDNGIGMTEEELDKYINSIALSGALDFISKYEGESSSGGIIGHFGLGFYSAFMVARNVEINTKSYTEASAVHWDCDDSGEFLMEQSEKAVRGSEICLHISDDETAYLEFDTVREILNKYCAYMPYEIFCSDGEKEERVNPSVPIWQKAPSEVADDEYKEFYKNMFSDYRDPLFYIHINADYPLNFKGVLYFPAPKNNFENKEGTIKLFYNSVFVADNIREVVPDYLSCLCGALDCPELPLNVSRSYLQDDAYVRKLSAHIVKKIADKLCKLHNDNTDVYYPLWDNIKPFIEYGCMKDNKFFERVKPSLVFKNANGVYSDFASVVDANDKKFYYTTDLVKQSYYVKLFDLKGKEVFVFDTLIDTQFVSFIESKHAGIKFLRVDSSLDDIGEEAECDEKIVELFTEAIGKDKEKIQFTSSGSDGVAALIQLPEESRRFADMMKMYSMINGEEENTPIDETIVLNRDSAIIIKLAEMDKNKAIVIAKHIYYTAVVANRSLTKDEMVAFMENEKLLYDLF